MTLWVSYATEEVSECAERCVGFGCRETLAAMMNKLTGDLRNTQHSGQSRREGGQVQAQAGQPLMPTTPQPHAALACPSSPAARPGSQLDHAPSLALIPSSTSLAVPASLTDEALPTLQLLPGEALLESTTYCASRCIQVLAI